MKEVVLGIETSHDLGGVALVADGMLIDEALSTDRLKHSEELMVLADRVLRNSGLELTALEAVSVSIGPGSFTGLRVGLATAKGLCLAGGIPLVAVPTLDALARMVDEREQSRSVHAIIDAKRGEVYWASYEFVKGEQRKTGGYLALSPAQLTERLIGDTVLVGSGVDRYKDYISNNVRCQVRFIDPNPRFPTPMLISILGLEKVRAGDVVEIDSAEPIYIRPSDAETRRGFE